MKKKLGKILVILGVISATVNLMSCANMSNEEVKQYMEWMEKQDQDIEKALDKVRESKEDNRTETIIGGEEKALDKVRESKEGKEPETFGYTINEKGERVYRVYDDYVGEEVDNPELYKDEYYIGEGGKKKVPTYDTVVDKWDKYSEEIKAIIKKYDGKNTYEISKNISQEDANKLAEEGIYLVGFNTHGREDLKSRDVNGGVLKAMTWDEAEQYALDWFNNHKTGESLQVGDKECVLEPFAYKRNYLPSESPVANARKIYTNTQRKEAYDSRQEFLSQFVLRNETAGSPAKYINALGGRQYFRDSASGNIYTKDGLEWASNDRNGGAWCKSRGIEFNDYRDVEMIVFKKNNPDCKIGSLPMAWANTKYKTFHNGNGEPRWVERDVHAVVYDIYGYKLSPVLYKSIDKYLDKCGGVKINGEVIAFGGRYVPYKADNKVDTFYYDRAIEGGIEGEVVSFLTDGVKENNNY